jgi:hypothetical protein
LTRDTRPPSDSSDERRFVNNPFARALHPTPSRSPIVRLLLGLISLLAAVVMMTAFVLPLLLVRGLVAGGVRSGRWGMVAAGVLIVLSYLGVLVGWIVRRVTRARRR